MIKTAFEMQQNDIYILKMIYHTTLVVDTTRFCTSHPRLLAHSMNSQTDD